MKLQIVSNQPIRLDRNVAGNEVLATVDTDHSLLTLLSMLQMQQARIEVVGKSDGDGDSDEPDDERESFAGALKAADFPTRVINALAKVGVESIAQARLYLRDHDDTFEPVNGVTAETDAQLKAFLDQQE